MMIMTLMMLRTLVMIMALVMLRTLVMLMVTMLNIQGEMQRIHTTVAALYDYNRYE
jgi:cell division protein FtsL